MFMLNIRNPKLPNSLMILLSLRSEIMSANEPYNKTEV